jgi:hypothetical protein
MSVSPEAYTKVKPLCAVCDSHPAVVSQRDANWTSCSECVCVLHNNVMVIIIVVSNNMRCHTDGVQLS